MVSREQPGRLLNVAQGQTAGRQVDDNNGNNEDSLGRGRQGRHRGHSVLRHSISCPLERSRKQSRHKILKGTRVEEVEVECVWICMWITVGICQSQTCAYWPMCRSVCFVWWQHDTRVTQGLGMCSQWRVVEGWRAPSDWEDSECLHGPDSYSAPLQPWESMGMFVCVRVCLCAWICAIAPALYFPLQRRLCLISGQATTNVPNCTGAYTCICVDAHVQPWPVTVQAVLCVSVSASVQPRRIQRLVLYLVFFSVFTK